MSFRTKFSSLLRRDQPKPNRSSRSHDRNVKDPSLSEVDQRSSQNTSVLNPVQDGLVATQMVGLESHYGHHRRQESSVQPDWTAASVMRRFLDSGEEFVWLLEARQSTGNHYDIPPSRTLPLKWERCISDTPTVSIEQYEVPNNTNSAFKQSFAVKCVRANSVNQHRQSTAAEVSMMKDLRHPHITALLGSFSYLERLHILIYPAPQVDLRQFMRQMSTKIQRGRKKSRQTRALDNIVAPPDDRGCSENDTESSTSGNESPDNLEFIRHAKRLKGHQVEKDRSWLSDTSQEDNISLLRRYFVCLSQALSYLHENSIRHNNIKPSNILIDGSQSVILSNFHTSHKTACTPKDAAPKFRKGTVIRDGSSDIFHLGCVFLEMATLICGHGLDELPENYFSELSSGTGFEGGRVEDYYHSLRRVHSWIFTLKETQSSSTTESHTAELLSSVQSMLDEDPQRRPLSRALWTQFSFISARICPDCDPRHPHAWKQSKDPKQSTGVQSLSKELTELHSRDNESDVSSIVSVKAPSIFSNQAPSSMTSVPEDQGAPEEFAKVLLTDEVMAPLYVAALHKIEIEKLERNLVRLLKSYARDLRLEAATELEHIAVKFARRYAQSIGNHLCESLDTSRKPRYLKLHLLSQQAPRNEQDIEQYRQQIAKANINSNVEDAIKVPEDITMKLTYAHSDDSGSDEVDHPGLSNFRFVKNFMTKSQAYSRLRENLQAFVEPVSEPKDQERVDRQSSGKQLPIVLSSDDSEKVKEIRGEELVDQDLMRESLKIISNSNNLRKTANGREKISVDQDLKQDHISASDDFRDNTETDSTTTDSSESQKSIFSVTSEYPSDHSWFVRKYTIMKRIISLAAEFLGVWEKPLKNGFERVRWTCVCSHATMIV